jgi:hypothetical protein
MSTKDEIEKRGIFIPGEVPSSKNSKEIGYFFLKAGTPAKIFVERGGKFLPVRLNLMHSDTTKRYIKDHSVDYMSKKVEFLNMIKGFSSPYRICFKFIRGSRRKFDYINAAQIVQDMMVEYGWITDDNCDELRPYFLEYEYDKKNPGVIISIF